MLLRNKSACLYGVETRPTGEPRPIICTPRDEPAPNSVVALRGSIVTGRHRNSPARISQGKQGQCVINYNPIVFSNYRIMRLQSVRTRPDSDAGKCFPFHRNCQIAGCFTTVCLSAEEATITLSQDIVAMFFTSIDRFRTFVFVRKIERDSFNFPGRQGALTCRLEFDGAHIGGASITKKTKRLYVCLIPPASCQDLRRGQSRALYQILHRTDA